MRAIPGRIEAEIFDTGASGTAYRDYNPVNNLVNLGTWKARDPTGVDLYSSGGIINVGSIESFEWMIYTVNVAHEGDYAVAFRAGSTGHVHEPLPREPERRQGSAQDRTPGGHPDIPLQRAPDGQLRVYQTGNLANTVHLTAGTHQLGVMFLGKNQNFDYMEFTRS